MKKLLIVLLLSGVGLYGQILTLTSNQRKVIGGSLVTYSIIYNGTSAAALQWDISPTYLLNWTGAGVKTLYFNSRQTRFVYCDLSQNLIQSGVIATATWTVPKVTGQFKLTLRNVLGVSPNGQLINVSAAAQ